MNSFCRRFGPRISHGFLMPTNRLVSHPLRQHLRICSTTKPHSDNDHKEQDHKEQDHKEQDDGITHVDADLFINRLNSQNDLRTFINCLDIKQRTHLAASIQIYEHDQDTFFGLTDESVERMAHDVFASVDLDNNNCLSKSEFLTYFNKKRDEARQVKPPTKDQLRSLMILRSVPYIGFGFFDNVVMIVFGEQIDSTFCASFGFSTMAAAALGNTISDLSGVGCGGVIERGAARIGLPDPKMTPQQIELSSSKNHSLLGCSLGITVGCLLGMFPLLFY